ncbi:MAG TPA: sigma factor-like helix-turn-helix DNA-binding protein, partial [Dehalococcoidia bacterium]|nr:sigma factor-like helix-turn-helix DNA-binding protein [Dehalococcoidia bacterium]
LILAALADLPPAQREAIELAYFGGLSQSAIAARQQAPISTVKTRLQLGLKKLGEALRAHRGDLAEARDDG